MFNQLTPRLNKQGWECPKCHAIYSPQVTECPHCKPKEHSEQPDVRQYDLASPLRNNVYHALREAKGYEEFGG